MGPDEDVKDLLLAAFNNDPKLRQAIIYAGIHRGVVTLLGEVLDESDKANAGRLAENTRGVASVRNCLAIKGVKLDREAQAIYEAG